MPHRPVDALLDVALAHYTRVEPPPGIEARLRARLQAEPPWGLRWAWRALLASGVAVLMVAGALYVARRSPSLLEQGAHVSPRLTAQVSGLVGKPAAPRPVTARQPVPATRHQATKQVRRESLPSRAPLSEQEMLLVEYAHGLPGEQLVAGRLGEPIRKLTLEELKIPGLVIEKLVSPGKQPGV